MMFVIYILQVMDVFLMAELLENPNVKTTNVNFKNRIIYERNEI